MNNEDFHEVVERIANKDPRFDKAAYYFLRQALEFTIKEITKKSDKNSSENVQHVVGHQLLEGIKTFALKQYGIMTLSILEHWGITQCADFGELVFNLVEYEIFGKTPQDSKDDFKDGYDFAEAFLEPFLPKGKPRAVL